MRNYLNTTFTFGKQINDKFINRKVQCRPQHQFIFSFLCPIFLWGESRGQNSRRTRNTPRSTAISDSSAGSAPRRTKQGRRCSHTTWSLDKLWAAFPWV